MTSCSEEGHIGRQRRPAIMEGEAVMPAPAAVKGSAYGPLRALDRGSRRHHFCPYGRRADVIAMYAVRRSWQVTLRRGNDSPAHNRGDSWHMARARLQEHRFIIGLRGAANRDDDAQPHIAQHPEGFCVFLPALPCVIVVRSSPRAMPHAAEGKLPERIAQGMDAGATKMDDANAGACSGHGRSARFALGDARVLIPVTIVAQFSHHPGGECVTSARQATVELAVRVEFQNPLDLPIVGVDMRRQRLELRNESAGESRLCSNDGRGNMKAGPWQHWEIALARSRLCGQRWRRKKISSSPWEAACRRSRVGNAWSRANATGRSGSENNVKNSGK